VASKRPRQPRDSSSPVATEGLAARRAALALLDAVLRRGEPMDRAVHAACQRMPSDDRALAIAIAGDALRWLAPLDELIDSAAQQTLPDDSKVRAVLRIALIQLLHMKIAPHAVVATSLALLVGGPRRLTHALLSRAQRDGWTLPPVPPLPEAVAARWATSWGGAMVAAAEHGWVVPPPLDLCFKDSARAEAFGEGESLAPRHRRLPRAGRVESLPGYDNGDWWVQDLAAAIPANLLGPGKGRAVVDLCAAPGGKTMQLAAAGWRVTAVDSSAKRLGRLEENLARTALTADIIAADIANWSPDAPFDAVLLDAPCSATGTFRRHPDVLHRVSPTDIAALAIVQHRMLERAADWVKPGGALVYATCSLERAEGEDIIAAFLIAHPEWQLAPVSSDQLPAGVAPAAEGWVRTGPTLAGTAPELDGFFIAKLTRAAALP
jgi:16S rRNA (cytosine967-C5)-methyltransferase